MDQGAADVGPGVARQRAQPGLHRVEVLDPGPQAQGEDRLAHLVGLAGEPPGILLHQHHVAGQVPEGHLARLGLRLGLLAVPLHVQGVPVDAAPLPPGQRGHQARDLLGPLAGVGPDLPLRLPGVQGDEAGGPPEADPHVQQGVEQPRPRGAGEAGDVHHRHAAVPHLGDRSGDQRVVPHVGVGVHTAVGKPDPAPLSRDALLDQLQLLVVLDPSLPADRQPPAGDGHREAVLELPDRAPELLQGGVAGGAASLLSGEEQALQPPHRRGHPGEAQGGEALEGASRLLEVLPPLLVDRRRDRIGEVAGRGGGVDPAAPAHGVGLQAPPGAQAPEGPVEPLVEGVALRRAHPRVVRGAVAPGGRQAAVLVEEDPLGGQQGVGEEIRQGPLLGAAQAHQGDHRPSHRDVRRRARRSWGLDEGG